MSVEHRRSHILCSMCGKIFSTKSSLLRHSKNLHKYVNPTSFRTKSQIPRLICPIEDCPIMFSRHDRLVLHLKENHEVDLPVEELNFANEHDFLDWKYEVQRETSVEYIKETSTKTCPDGSRKLYLVCHRLYRPNRPLKNTEDRQRALKSQGSKKVTKSCPSRIEVVYNQDLTLYVKFWTNHYGHTRDLYHISLDKPTKEYLASKLRNGVTFEHILDEVRSNQESAPRTLLLDKKDLHNLVRDKNIAYSKRRHAEDVNAGNPASSKRHHAEDVIVENPHKLLKKANTIIDLLSNRTNLSGENCVLVEKNLDKIICFLKKVPSDSRPESQMVVNIHAENDHTYYISSK